MPRCAAPAGSGWPCRCREVGLAAALLPHCARTSERKAWAATCAQLAAAEHDTSAGDGYVGEEAQTAELGRMAHAGSATGGGGVRATSTREGLGAARAGEYAAREEALRAAISTMSANAKEVSKTRQGKHSQPVHALFNHLIGRF